MKAFKIALIIVAVLVLLIGGLAAWGYYAFLHTTPLEPEQIAELEVDWTTVTHGNWSPWVTADDGTQQWNPAKSYNDWLATVPDEDKAWPLIAELDYKYDAFRKNEDLGYGPVHPALWARAIQALDTDEAREMNQGILEAFQRPVMGAGLSHQSDPIEVAIAKRYGHEWAMDAAPVDPNEEVELIKVLLPGLASQKWQSEIALEYASRRLELGESDVFVRSVGVVMNAADLSVDMPTLIGDLVKIAIRNRAMESIDWALDKHAGAFSDAQLAELDSLLADPEQFDIGWQGESLMFEDTIRRLASENGSLKPIAMRTKANQIGSSSLGAATDLPVTQLHASAQRMIYIHQQVVKRDLGDEDHPDFGTGWSYYQSQRTQLGKFEQLTLDMLIPALGKAKSSSQLAERYASAVRIAIAARRHELRHGTLPDTLGAIDPDLIAAGSVIDPLTDEQLTYQRLDDGFQILPSHPEDEPDVILWPKQYEPIIEDDEPEYYDWELEGLSEEQKQEILEGP